MELHPPKESFSGVGAFIKRFFSLIAQNIVLLLSVSIGVAVLGVVGTQVFTGMLSSQSEPVLMYLMMGLYMLLSIAAVYFIYVLLAVILSVRLRATSGPMNAAVTEGIRRLPRVIGYSLLMALVIMAGFVCLVIPGIYLGLRLFPVTYVALFEPDQNVFQRSWQLTEYRTFEAFLCLVAMVVIAAPVGMILGGAMSQLPGFPGSLVLGQTIEALTSYVFPSVFWFLLYIWFREDMPVIHFGAVPEAESVEA